MELNREKKSSTPKNGRDHILLGAASIETIADKHSIDKKNTKGHFKQCIYAEKTVFITLLKHKQPGHIHWIAERNERWYDHTLGTMLKNVVFFVKSLKRLARNNNTTATFAIFLV